MTDLVVSDLTQSTLEGTGVFDVLMRSTKTHLEAEFSKNRIKGAEYATVYLGSLDSVMRTSMEFLLQKQRIGLEAQLLEQQILLAQVGVLKANAELAIVEASLAKIPLELAQLTAQTELVNAQKANTVAELAIIQANALKVPVEIDQLIAQTAVTTQQKLNLVAEAANIPKQGLLIDAQALNTSKQAAIAEKELLIKEQQVLVAIEEVLVKKQQVQVSIAEVAIAQAKLINIPKEGAQLEAQTALVGQQKLNLVSEKLGTEAKTALTGQQQLNAVIEGTVLTATECKLRAEFDVLMVQKLKGASENSLLLQKVVTEAAQTTATGVDDNSVIGRQKALYLGQTDGFKRDAEQKATKILIDTWNVRKTADSDATGVVVLDADITAAVNKLKAGIAA